MSYSNSKSEMPSKRDKLNSAKKSDSKSSGESKSEIAKKQKLMIVRKIGENKDILFGSYSATITKELKTQKWKEIVEYATSIGFKNNGDWEYFRKTTWGQNWKRRAVEKWEEMNKTGAGGGEEIELTEVDEAILDVIGRESAAIVGISGARESLEEPTDESIIAVDSIQNETRIMRDDDVSTGEAALTSSRPCERKKRKEPEKFFGAVAGLGNVEDHELQQLKKEKAALQVEQLKLVSYKTKLEIMKLERDLGLSHKYPVDTPRETGALSQFDYDDMNSGNFGARCW